MVNVTQLTIVATIYAIVLILRLWQQYNTFDIFWIWKAGVQDIKTRIIVLVVFILLFILAILVMISAFKSVFKIAWFELP